VNAQLILDLPVRTASGRDDFLVTPANAAAVAALDGWRGWTMGRLVLTGPHGSGKSHLAAIWAEAAAAAPVAGAALAQADVPALAATGAVVVDDADAVAGDVPGQTALFHLLNLCAQSGAVVLLTACRLPRDWQLTLPDLASRIEAAPLARLEPPDDALLAAVLVKLFADRQVTVDPALIAYLTARMDRSLASAARLVEALDRLALQRGRPISRALAAEVLGLGETEGA
jgi:chromosomal replication initiation ATPase DnaA